MNIASICSRRIVTIDSAGTPVQAAGLMREHHVGALVVITQAPEGPQVSGIVTDRDLVIGALASGRDRGGVTIGELASDRNVSVSEEDDLSGAIAVMREGGVRRLLVTNAEQQLVGVVSLDDLMDACAAEMAGLAKVIRNGIEREVGEISNLPPPAPLVLRIPSMGTAGWGNAMA